MFSGLAHVNTAATRSFSHAITFGIDLAVFTNIVQFAVAKTNKSRTGMPFCRKWGPVFCLIWATLLSMADLVRHLINDAWSNITLDSPSWEEGGGDRILKIKTLAITVCMDR